MDAPILTLTLIPSPNDPPLTSDVCQRALHEFVSAVSGAGFDVSQSVQLQESAGSEAVLLGEFFITLVKNKDLWLVLGPLIAAWITRRNGRKVRVKIGDIEAEAQSREEVEKLLESAHDIQQRHQPKMIHER